MHLLITAATPGELAMLNPNPQAPWLYGEIRSLKAFGHEIDLLPSGPGLAATSYHLTRALCSRTYDLALQIGIAGSYDRQLNLGEVVYVEREWMADLGADAPDGFLSVFDLGLMDPDTPPFQKGELVNRPYPLSKELPIPSVAALTRQTVTGSDQSLSLWEHLPASYQLESMEGAAFYFVCLQEGQSCLQVRGISNYVEKRSKKNWQMEKALSNIHEWLRQALKLLPKWTAKPM